MPRLEVVLRRRVIEADLHQCIEGDDGVALLRHRPLPRVECVGPVQECRDLRPRGELDELDHRDAVLRADHRRPLGDGE